MNREPVIELRRANYELPGGQTLLSGIDLAVGQGETLVLLGPSRSGKTTLLKLINRLVDPTSSEALVEGRATTEWDPIRLCRRTLLVATHTEVPDPSIVTPRAFM